MTKWLSHRMVERGIIKEEEQELYQFGIRNGMILLLNVVTALVIWQRMQENIVLPQQSEKEITRKQKNYYTS